MFTVSLFKKNIATNEIDQYSTEFELKPSATAYLVGRMHNDVIDDIKESENSLFYEVERQYVIVNHSTKPETIVRDVKVYFKG